MFTLLLLKWQMYRPVRHRVAPGAAPQKDPSSLPRVKKATTNCWYPPTHLKKKRWENPPSSPLFFHVTSPAARQNSNISKHGQEAEEEAEETNTRQLDTGPTGNRWTGPARFFLIIVPFSLSSVLVFLSVNLHKRLLPLVQYSPLQPGRQTLSPSWEHV